MAILITVALSHAISAEGLKVMHIQQKSTHQSQRTGRGLPKALPRLQYNATSSAVIRGFFLHFCQTNYILEVMFTSTVPLNCDS